MAVMTFNELKDRLQRIDRGMKTVTDAVEHDAAEFVVRYTRPRVPVGPGKNGHAVESLRVEKNRAKGGGPNFPYYFWLDFGGVIEPRPGQFIERNFRKTGRFLWLTYATKKFTIDQMMLKALRDHCERNGIDVSEF